MVENAKVTRERARQSSLLVALLMLLAVVGVWLMMASVVWAGEWTQVTCTQPDGRPAPVEGWESVNGGGPGSGPSDTCESGGALSAFDSSSAEETAYSGPMWTYTAPSGSTITGGALTVSLLTPQGQAYVATPQNSFTSSADVLVNCQYNTPPCASSGLGITTVPIVHPGGTQLFMAAFCVAPTEGATRCPAGSGGGVNAEINLYAAEVQLQNNSTPIATNFAGTLLEPNASGTADLTFSAKDPEGPGVYRVTVDVDGNVAYQGTPEANGGRCASIGFDSSGGGEFLYPQPCKREVAVDVPVNTSKLADGSHSLKVTVQDAAGNTAVVDDGTISTSNPNAKTSSGVVTGGFERGPANGANASEDATLTARWAGTASAQLTSNYRHPHPLVITGRLTGPNGTPITGAMIDLTATPAYEGARPLTMPSPRTGADGDFRVSLPGGLSSRTLRLTYRSHVNDKVPATTRTLTLEVRAAIRLSIAPHVAVVQQRIFFTGVLHGGPIPHGGKQLVLEAQSASGSWLEFDVIRTDSHGRFHASHRFKYPGPATYRFRVLSKYEADFPFVAGASNTVEVDEL